MLKEIKTKNLHFFVDENDLIQGEFKDYYENGQLREHSSYTNGKRHGEYKDYYSNGQLWEHESYQNDKLHGEYYKYNGNGDLIRSTFYYNGTDLHVNPDTLTQKDKTYIMLSGRLPPKN